MENEIRNSRGRKAKKKRVMCSLVGLVQIAKK